MKTTGRCIVLVETKKKEFYQVALDGEGMSFVLEMLEQYFDGDIGVLKKVDGIWFEKKRKTGTF